MGMTVQAQEARRSYQREYRNINREAINARKRQWNRRNPDKLREYQQRYWQKKARLRASWEDHGIDEERRKELRSIAKMDEYADIVSEAALRADELAAGHILLSAIEGLPYEKIEFHKRLGRCPLGRTSFYGARRLFYHYLDELLKGQEDYG